MKKTWLFTSVICSAMLLSACASPASGSGSGSGSGGSGAGSGFSGNRAFTLTDEDKLALGTIKLDTSPQAISRDEAAKLLPLWQLLRQLHSSSSAAPQEIAAVVAQIRATMTPAQASAIDGMQMTRADIFAAFQQGQANASSSNSTGSTGSRSGNFAGGGNRANGGGQAFFFSGGGGIPGGGGLNGGAFRNGTGGSGGTTNGTSSQQGSNSAQRSQAFGNGITTALVNQVITLLQDKLAS